MGKTRNEELIKGVNGNIEIINQIAKDFQSKGEYDKCIALYLISSMALKYLNAQTNNNERR